VELLQRRVSRMARMEEAIERQRAAQRAERDTLQRRLLNAALAVRGACLSWPHACCLCASRCSAGLAMQVEPRVMESLLPGDRSVIRRPS
jgi:hypothetical protein